MRRGIGVGHIQQKKQTQQTMADLGATITAERVSQIMDQLETLEQRLKELAEKHRRQIKHDPVLRARFRQLADSLGVDLISSGQTNVFSKALGLGDYYYELSIRVIECCMKERKFCGSLVPLQSIVRSLNRKQQQPPAASSIASNSSLKAEVVSPHSSLLITSSSEVSEDDVVASLQKLKELGPGYSVVTVGEERYVQAGGGVHSDDVLALVQTVAQLFKKSSTRRVTAPAAAAGLSSTKRNQIGSLGGGGGTSCTAVFRGGVATHADPSVEAPKKLDADVPTSVVPHATLGELCSAMGWKSMRVEAAVNALVRDGSLWVDVLSTPGSTRYWFVSFLSLGNSFA